MTGSEIPAVRRMKARALVTEYVAQLRNVAERNAQEIDPLTGELPRRSPPEEGWRRDAQAVGLPPQETADGWAWFRRHAFEAPPVLEETEQRIARLTMPDSVRRVLNRNPMWRFVGYDHDILRDFDLDEPAEEPTAGEDDQRFDHDIILSLTDPRQPEVRRALDRIAKRVHLLDQHLRELATQRDQTMRTTKRHLIQTAVLEGLDAAEQPIRIGRRTTKADRGHPITLENVFERKGLDELRTLAIMGLHPPESIHEELEIALGGPFRPAYLTDRRVFRNWLKKEIGLQTVRLLGKDLDIDDAGRIGGSRRTFVSYDESQPLGEDDASELPMESRAVARRDMRAEGEREDREKGASRTTDARARTLTAVARKDRIELKLAHGIDWQRSLERVRREHPGRELGRYITYVTAEPLLFGDDVAAANRLGWKMGKVSDTKRNLKGHLRKQDGHARWDSRFSDAS